MKKFTHALIFITGLLTVILTLFSAVSTFALIGSTGNLGIALVNGDASTKLGVKQGDEILVKNNV